LSNPVFRSGMDRGVEVDEQHILAKCRGVSANGPLGVDGERVAVEEQLIVAADEVAKRHRNLVAPRVSGDERDPAIRLALLERRRAEIHDHVRAGRRELRNRIALVSRRRPRVLADRDADLVAPDLDRGGGLRPGEPAALVEHVVVGQKPLEQRLDPAVMDEQRGVIQLAVVLDGTADQQRRQVGARAQRLERGGGPREERPLVEQVARHVAAEAQLGEHDEVRVQPFCRGQNPLEVAVEVSNGRIDLRQRDLHMVSVSATPFSRTGPTGGAPQRESATPREKTRHVEFAPDGDAPQRDHD